MAIPQIAPTSGGGDYTSIQEGENKLRIVSEIIAGYKWWTVAGKVVRSETAPAKRPADCRPPSGDYDNGPAVQWACMVYNYDTRKLELWEFGQKGITEGLTKLDNDPDWGDPQRYGIKVFKNNEKGKISYSVMPGKEAPLSAEILEAMEAKPFNLHALFQNGNVFEAAPAAPAKTAQQQPAVQPPVDDSDLPF